MRFGKNPKKFKKPLRHPLTFTKSILDGTRNLVAYLISPDYRNTSQINSEKNLSIKILERELKAKSKKIHAHSTQLKYALEERTQELTLQHQLVLDQQRRAHERKEKSYDSTTALLEANFGELALDLISERREHREARKNLANVLSNSKAQINHLYVTIEELESKLNKYKPIQQEYTPVFTRLKKRVLAMKDNITKYRANHSIETTESS